MLLQAWLSPLEHLKEAPVFATGMRIPLISAASRRRSSCIALASAITDRAQQGQTDDGPNQLGRERREQRSHCSAE